MWMLWKSMKTENGSKGAVLWLNTSSASLTWGTSVQNTPKCWQCCPLMSWPCPPSSRTFICKVISEGHFHLSFAELWGFPWRGIHLCSYYSAVYDKKGEMDNWYEPSLHPPPSPIILLRKNKRQDWCRSQREEFIENEFLLRGNKRNTVYLSY